MELDEVYERIRESPKWEYLRGPGVNFVPGYGNSTDPVAMIVGEAPSAHAALKRKPFSGNNARILKQLMELAGLYADHEWCDGGDKFAETTGPIPANTFVTTLLKYPLPGNRKPTSLEFNLATKALRGEWAAIGKPPLIVTLGMTAYLFGRRDFNPTPGSWAALKDGKTFVWFQHDPATATDEADQEIIERQWGEMGEWASRELLG